jgi:Na+-driven multidrug efflux pump
MFFFPDEDYYKIVGTFTGFYAGYLIETRWIRFDVKASWWLQVIKFIGGLAVLLLLKEMIKLVLPESIFSDFVRYFLLVIWVSVLAPLIYKQINRILPGHGKQHST